MFENCRNTFLDYIDDIKDDFYHSSKRIKLEQIMLHQRVKFWDTSLASSCKMKLNMPKGSQVLISEST